MKSNLTTGSILKNIIFFSIPYFISYFLQTLYGMADLFIIGQFNGVKSITAVSTGSQVMHMLTVIIVGLAMGSTVMVGRAMGGNHPKQASIVIGNTITLFMAVSVILMVLLLISVAPIVSLMSTPTEAVSETISYLTICFIGIPFITAYNIMSAILRGMGDSKRPMYFIAIACFVNIILDYLFIGLLDRGSSGAALGTILSQTLSVIIALFIILRQKNGIHLSFKHLIPQKDTMATLLKVGVPIAVQDGFIQISFVIILIIANKRGLNDAAAVGIVEKIIGILFLVPSSMLSTVSALSAHNIGGGKTDRANKTLKYAIIIAVSFGLISSIIMMYVAKPIIQLFTDNSIVVLLGTQYISGYVWDCIFAGIHFSFSGYFCAFGLSGISFAHNFISILCVRIPLAYFASVTFSDTLLPMGIASPAGSALSVIICICFYAWMNKFPYKFRGLESNFVEESYT